MQTKKVQKLDDFLKSRIQFFIDTLSKEARTSIHYENFEDSVSEEDFQIAFEEFEKELTDNILLYKDREIIRTYIIKYLGPLLSWEGLDSNINDEIMDSGCNIQFLFELKKRIEIWMKRLKEITWINSNASMSFNIFFDSVIGIETADSLDSVKYVEGIKPIINERFDFDKMIAECRNNTTDIISQIDFIQDRLADLKQWQLLNDKNEGGEHRGLKFTLKESMYALRYYSNFVTLCNMELERLERKDVLENRRLKRSVLEQNPVIIQNQKTSPYKWSTTSTDFLELITALHSKEVIVRTDGQKTTRTELINYFSELLHLEVKDPDGKLSKATARNTLCPFLDKLKIAFQTYAGEK